MQRYALGFLFDVPGERVLLIRKNRPAWQAGKLNGIGGKLEPGESPLQAMVREFREETGLETRPHAWAHFGTMQDLDFQVHCFSGISAAFDDARSTTDEAVVVVGARDFGRLAAEGVSNLVTLVAHAADPDRAFLHLAYRELATEQAKRFDVHSACQA